MKKYAELTETLLSKPDTVKVDRNEIPDFILAEICFFPNPKYKSLLSFTRLLKNLFPSTVKIPWLSPDLEGNLNSFWLFPDQ